MSNRLRKTVMLLALAACSTLALADDPPAQVGRVALVQGQVSIRSDDQPASNALLNWPVTSHQLLTTAAGARTELRVGSTSVRLDGGSALEVVELDESHLRLHLHYGSASIRIVDAGVLPGFELTTPQARVRMREPGRLRVDANREPDTSAVSVFAGTASVEGADEELTVRAGLRAELQGDEVRTSGVLRDAFDDWSRERDRYEDAAPRYVSSDMTGYEDLDRYGSWSSDPEFGTLWIPSVGPGWVPYRDGSWVWLDPWGWTWVDNAPWGYAPFHYGRWVYTRHHWGWVPGRREHHPVWSPALVGWVGGAGWNVHFGHDRRHKRPAQGWYPLSPHERFVPTWRAPEQHQREWNGDVRPDRRHGHDYRPGLTVVPHDAFTRHGRVPVAQAPKAAPAPQALQNAAAAAPPPPRDWHRPRREDRRVEPDRFGHGQRGPVSMAPPLLSTVPQTPVTLPGQLRTQQAAPQTHGEPSASLQIRRHPAGLQPRPGTAAAMPHAARSPAPQPGPVVLTAPPVQHAENTPWQRNDRERFEDHRRRDGGESGDTAQARPAPAPVPLQAGPGTVPGYVHHGGMPERREKWERREREFTPAPRPTIATPEAARALPPQARQMMAPPETARPLPLPPQARAQMAPPETARPLPLPPQARAQMAPPETARPLPLPSQARAQMAPPEAARPMPAQAHPAPPTPPQPQAHPAPAHPGWQEHGRGGNEHDPRRQER